MTAQTQDPKKVITALMLGAAPKRQKAATTTRLPKSEKRRREVDEFQDRRYSASNRPEIKLLS